MLARIGFSSRKETVSQKIPDNWEEQSRAFSKHALSYFHMNKVDVICCADQTFIKYLLAKEHLLVPTGTRRVGTGIESPDERKGITLMLTAYVNCVNGVLKSGVLPPFMVFNGKTGATLDKRYADWSRRPGHIGSMNFQKKHWFDTAITLRWIQWLISQFPVSMRIGLVWDRCPSHEAEKVSSLLKELEDSRRLFSVIIPGGLTSVLQLGDLILNRPCKNYLRKKFCQFQMNEIEKKRGSGVSGKIVIKITREMLMCWTEDFINMVNSNMEMDILSTIVPCLTKIGQNCFNHDEKLFDEWLSSLNTNSLYKSMVAAHTAAVL